MLPVFGEAFGERLSLSAPNRSRLRLRLEQN
jgi:hypothetical protein